MLAETIFKMEVTQGLHPSTEVAQRFLLDIENALRAFKTNSIELEMDAVAWPLGLDRTILNQLPLQTRTRNSLLRSKLMEGDSLLTVKQFLICPDFGRKSLKDLLYTVENYLKECIQNGNTDSQSNFNKTECSGPVEPYNSTTQATMLPTPWENAVQHLNPLLATAAELFGARSITDVLSPDVMRLATRMGIENAISAIKIDDLSNGVLGPVTVSLYQIESTIGSLSDTERAIFNLRLMRTPPTTLEEVGVRRGVSRERIRQVQARLERKLHIAVGTAIRMIAPEIKEQFGHIVEESEVERWFKNNLPVKHGLALKYFKKILLAEMGFTLSGGIYIDELAEKEFQHVKAVAYRLADDVGLVNQTEFIEELSDKEWHRHILWVCERVGLHNLHGSLSLKCSAKARAKAALLSIGRPATRSEIGRVCGFNEGRVGAHLSNIPSIVRADKERWGLREWIDDEYNGIVAEIIQRIEEDGGVTTVERLLKELPEKFDVSPNSVRSYMQTAKFSIREGLISMATTSSIQLRHLDDVIDGRDKTGAPYWTFLVEARYFNGYSVLNVPPEFAKALGCEPDGSEYVCVDNLPGQPTLSIRWPLASTTGASFGYIAEPLQQLELKVGGRARVTIKGPRLVSLDADQSSAEDARSGEADAILDRIIQRRKVF